MDLGLSNRGVIVTGAGSNIGRAIALAFAAEKAKVAIVDLDEAQAQKVAERARQLGAADALAIRTDVTKWEQVQAMAKQVEGAFGGVDILVNNVGWVIDRLFMEKPREEWEREVQVNLWSTINCSRAVLDGMVARGNGVVINIGSDAGRIGEYREAVYGACKGAIIALSKALARELGPKGIRFNVVCPGTTLPETEEEMSANSLWKSDIMSQWNTPEMKERIAKAYPLRRIGKPDDMTGAVLFFASERASFITGQTLSISGGYTMM